MDGEREMLEPAGGRWSWQDHNVAGAIPAAWWLGQARSKAWGIETTSQYWLSPQGALVRRIIYRLKGTGVTRVNGGKVEQRRKEQGDSIDSPMP